MEQRQQIRHGNGTARDDVAGWRYDTAQQRRPRREPRTMSSQDLGGRLLERLVRPGLAQFESRPLLFSSCFPEHPECYEESSHHTADQEQSPNGHLSQRKIGQC